MVCACGVRLCLLWCCVFWVCCGCCCLNCILLYVARLLFVGGFDLWLVVGLVVNNVVLFHLFKLNKIVVLLVGVLLGGYVWL